MHHMIVELLHSEEGELVRRCLATLIDGGDLHGKFHARLGVTQSEAAELLMRWPHLDVQDVHSPASVAIYNALNEVLNGPHLSDADFERRIGVKRSRLVPLYRAWTIRRNRQSSSPPRAG
jgi:hypothetical protein